MVAVTQSPTSLKPYLQIVYITSIALCMVGCIVAATAKTINVLIGMRCLQAAGYVHISKEPRAVSMD